MPVAGSYYLAYVAPGTAFDPTVHNVMDEYVFDLDLKISEGDKPLLTLEILNPHIGLLNTARQQWIWLSRMEANGYIVPRFYGRIMAVPTNLVGEVITVNFISWPIDYFEQLQALAETIKVTGPYDDVFIDPSKVDDPDTILEAVSGTWCINPVTNVVTIEDYIDPSAGNVTITADDHFYDGFEINIDQQAPLTSLLMDAQVGWNQTAIGYVDMGSQTIQSYGGDGIIDDWPKPLQQLGGGWSVFNSLASDLYNVLHGTFIGTVNYHWNNGEKTHNDGDALSVNLSYSMPGLAGPYKSGVVFFNNQDGYLDPFATDENGDPSPVNIPPHSEQTDMYVPRIDVKTSMTLRYDAVRPRTERILMLMNGDFQATVVDPLVTQYSEKITKQGRDVGRPVVNYLNWLTIAGQSIAINTIVFPDLPTLPGGQSMQIATTAGVAGAVEPNFSDVPGDTTVDNTVVWTSLGQNQPSDGNYADWSAVTNLAPGTIIVPRQVLYTTWTVLLQPGLVQFPQVGVGASLGQVVQGSNGYFFACTLDGTTGIVQPSWPSSYGATVTDADVEWTCIGNVLPDGKTLFLASAVSGATGAQYLIPPFGASSSLHSIVSDGGVTWVNVGQGDIPAGGTIGNVWAQSYFDTSRGLTSIEYLLSIMRAKMRLRGRAAKIKFDCAANTSLGMDCRQTCLIEDTRIPGGTGLGKITLVNLHVNGDNGEEIVHVEVGCAIGKDNAITTVPGQATYVTGYVTGYRVSTGTIQTLPDLSDVGYTPPTAPGVDDGINFADMNKSQVVVSEQVRGSLANQEAGIALAIASASKAAVLATYGAGTIARSIMLQKEIALAQANTVALQLQKNPIWYDLVLKPLNRPFSNVYRVQLTDLTMPKGIDLAGASTP